MITHYCRMDMLGELEDAATRASDFISCRSSSSYLYSRRRLWPPTRSIEDSKPKAAHDPDDPPNNADDETCRAEKDRNDKSIALGKASRADK